MSEENSLQGGRRQAAVGFIFITSLIDILAMGIMIPVLPLLVKRMVGGDTADAAVWTMVFAILWGLMQFTISPILGMLSDRFGRRAILLSSIFGLGIDFLFMALAPTIWWLLLGRIINGATAASFSTANAYIADITAPQNRAKAFGLLGAAFGVGFTFGPALGGLLSTFDERLPFYVCAGLALCNWLYGYFVLPESLPVEKRIKTVNWSRANPLGSLALLRSRIGLLGLASVGFLFQLAHNVLPMVFVLYTSHRYGWSPLVMGVTMMGTGISSVLVQTLLISRTVKAIGERGGLLLGLASGAVGFAIYALAPSGILYLIGIPIFALSGLIQPCLQALMTRKVGPQEQGQLQGANSAMMGIAGIMGPMIFGSTFAFALHHEATLRLPGLPILIAASMMTLAMLLAARFAKTPSPAEPQAV
ncbi:MAG: major facilitator superfamily 1 [Caulobacter sp.]|nr:major facilitator superfamily 1 [Caulobacter sp.]